jgi:flagellin-like protein
MSGGRDRGVTSTIAIVLLIAIVVLLSATVFAVATGFTDDLREPARATVTAERTTLNFGAASECAGPEEVAVNVTLTSFDQADTIYVIVADEGGEDRKTLWDDPSVADVGTTLTLANEVTGPQVDVDIGGSGDFAFCPGDAATFRFYAEFDGQTTILQRFDL